MAPRKFEPKRRPPPPKKDAGPTEKSRTEIEQEQRALVQIHAAKKAAHLREQREELRKEVKAADAKKTVVLDRSTQQVIQVAEVDARWLERDRVFLPCLPGDEGNGSEQLRTLEFLQAMDEDLSALLRMPYARFWSHVAFEPQLRPCLDAFLRHAPRGAVDYRRVDPDVDACRLAVTRGVLLVYLRLSQVRESEEAFLTPEQHAAWVTPYASWPALTDLAQVYGATNRALVREVVANLVAAVPHLRGVAQVRDELVALGDLSGAEPAFLADALHAAAALLDVLPSAARSAFTSLDLAAWALRVEGPEAAEVAVACLEVAWADLAEGFEALTDWCLQLSEEQRARLASPATAAFLGEWRSQGVEEEQVQFLASVVGVEVLPEAPVPLPVLPQTSPYRLTSASSARTPSSRGGGTRLFHTSEIAPMSRDEKRGLLEQVARQEQEEIDRLYEDEYDDTYDLYGSAPAVAERRIVGDSSGEENDREDGRRREDRREDGKGKGEEGEGKPERDGKGKGKPFHRNGKWKGKGKDAAAARKKEQHKSSVANHHRKDKAMRKVGDLVG